MIISHNLDANTQFLYTIGSDNKKIKIVPSSKPLYTSDIKNYDFSCLPNDDPAALLALAKEECKRIKKCRPVKKKNPFKFNSSINRPNGILTENAAAATRRLERARAADAIAAAKQLTNAANLPSRQPRNTQNDSNLTLASLTNVPKVRMIDRRIPTIAGLGARSSRLFPPGTRTSDDWNQEDPATFRTIERMTPEELQSTLRAALQLNRARLSANLQKNNRLRVAPKRRKRIRVRDRMTFPFV